jgi:hypothetical protein
MRILGALPDYRPGTLGTAVDRILARFGGAGGLKACLAPQGEDTVNAGPNPNGRNSSNSAAQTRSPRQAAPSRVRSVLTDVRNWTK